MTPSRTSRTPDPVDQAIVDTVLYYDLLDYPLTCVELRQYLCHPAPAAVSLDELQSRTQALVDQRVLAVSDEYVMLAGRERLAADRERNAPVDRRNWKRAKFFIRLFSFVPFVRMVAVSGSLALDRSSDESDIDLFIVARRGRVWLVRAFCVLIARAFGLYRSERTVAGRLCLNHFVTDEAMTLDHQNLYTARLFSHLVTGFSLATCHAFQQANLWIREYIPTYPWDNFPPFEVREAGGLTGGIRRLGELLLGRFPGDRLESLVKHYQLGRIGHDQRRLDERAQIVLLDRVLRFHLEAQEPVMLARFQQRSADLSGFTKPGTADTLKTYQKPRET